jgi:glycosyltransferase involved in cell wall biosynthesis
VANLIPYKGHADLLDAFGSIREQLPQNWELWCVGRDDGIGQGLKERAERLGIASHVRFLGSRSDVPDLLLRADVGVLCSHEEGFSNAVLEAMAAGLPMVVTDVGGNAEAVVDGDTGYVVPPKDPPRLAEALLSVALDARRSDMGARGRKRAEELFSMDACLHQYELLYQEAVPALRVTPATAD